MNGISHDGDDAERRFMELTGARPSPNKAFGDCVLEHHFVEVKKVTGRDGVLNQVRPLKYIPIVAWEVVGRAWYVVPPHAIVGAACDKLRGQHTANPFECASLPLVRFRGYRVDAGQLREATLGCIALSAEHRVIKAAMRDVQNEVRAMAQRHRIGVRAALDADAVVDLHGSMLLPW